MTRNEKSLNTIRIAVVGTNEIVIPFWEKMGFLRTGETSPYRYDKVETVAHILEKKLSY
ncbi:MAG: hypothetical protein AB7T49_07435 [Oligoflexales bacterium]